MGWKSGVDQYHNLCNRSQKLKLNVYEQVQLLPNVPFGTMCRSTVAMSLRLFIHHLICVRTNEIKQFVLDEADEMLSRGFKDQIYDVFRHLNSEIQVGAGET